MKACVLEGPKNYQIKDIPVPEMKEDGTGSCFDIRNLRK